MQGTTENIGNKPKVTNSVIDAVIAIYAGSFLSRWGKNIDVMGGKAADGFLEWMKIEFTFEGLEKNHLGRRYAKGNKKVHYVGIVIYSESLKIVNLM